MALPIIAAGALAPIAATFAKYFVGYAIVRIVVALGISLLSFGAVDQVAGFIQSRIESNVSGIGGQFASIASALGVFTAINIISSAYIGAVTVRQIMGAFNRITFAGTGGQ